MNYSYKRDILLEYKRDTYAVCIVSRLHEMGILLIVDIKRRMRKWAN